MTDTIADEFGEVAIVTESRDMPKAHVPVESIPQSVKNAVETANADRSKRVVVGPLKDKVTATRFASLCQSYGIQFPNGRITVRATVRDDHSVAVTTLDYVKRTLEQETKDKMRLSKLEKAVKDSTGDKAKHAKALAALKAAKAEIEARDKDAA